jgi:predicted NBD/HSP70 family sugar kinase
VDRHPVDTEEDRPRRVLLRGSNLIGVRDHNERLVLTVVRQHGPLSKAGIARLTGLSAQTVSVIVRALEAEGLLRKGQPVRGKVGQPSVPIALAPDGAFFFGLKIGRRSAELVLANFVGSVVARSRLTYQYPMPAEVLGFAADAMVRQAEDLGPAAAGRIAGLGIAMPFQIWEWGRVIGLPGDAMDAWRTMDVKTELEAVCSYPVYLQNDASAACGAELVFGQGTRPSDFLYFYVGYFIGGGIVLRDNLFVGRTGNAAAFGSMPVPTPDGRVAQLIELASLSALEDAMRGRGLDSGCMWTAPEGWSIPNDLNGAWIATASYGIAHAIGAAASVIDFEAVLIDGWLPAETRRRLVEGTRAALVGINLAGILAPDVLEGSVGPDARALGAASLPLSERFLATSARTMIDV